MEAQYYTPTIDEFHVGFEYETNYLSKEWEKRTLKIDEADWFFDTYYKDATSVEFCVKHLDRQDIEECGWEIRTDDNRDLHNPEYTIQRFYFKAYPDNFFTIWDDSAVDEYCFRGTIRNKSELVKLMQMLNISPIEKVKCDCYCHKSDQPVMHVSACCDNGYITKKE